MKRSLLYLLFVLIFSALVLTACGGGGGGNTSEGDTRAEVPAPFAGQANPMAGDDTAVAAGQEVYTTYCASCHGDSGQGDGPAAASLDPAPANLVETANETEPDYTHWVISEGGAAAGLSSSMPAFEGTLSEDQIWQVTTFIESLGQ